MSDIAVRVDNLSKIYRIGSAQDRYPTLRDSITNAFVAPVRRINDLLHGQSYGAADLREEVWALKDVSFEVKRGEVMGIVGHNGAGKSTLLKVLSRITEPTKGTVDLYGRIAALLEVGTGFHPELTGRENVYLNAAILGMSRREIDLKFDEIVDFAGVEKFIDTPVKHYSSGMGLRLGFSVAAHLDTDILVVDEVLAVGDAVFQKKCLGKMNEVANTGSTVLFVSHNLGAVNSLCSQAIWLETGQVKMIDRTDIVVQQYLTDSYQGDARRTFEPNPNLKAQILEAHLMNDTGQETAEFSTIECPTVQIRYRLNEAISGMHVAMIITTGSGYHLFSTTDGDKSPDRYGKREAGEYVAQVQLPTNNLNVGTYHITIAISIPNAKAFDRQDALSFTLFDTGDEDGTKVGGRRKGLLVHNVPWSYDAEQEKAVLLD